MNKKTLFCTIALSVLLLSGCGQGNSQGGNNSSTSENNKSATDVPSESVMPSTTADVAQDKTQSSAHPQSNTTQNGNADGTMISEEKAKEIALAHAGLTSDQVTFVKSGIDKEDGRSEYNVEFYTKDQKEYDYEIDPYSGEILDYDYDAEYHTQSSGVATDGGAANGTNQGTENGKSISTDEAKQIALKKVPGATDKDIREFKSDYDNSKLQYEGKIYYDKKEYEFEIDGTTGTILEWDVESIYGGA